MSDLSALLDQWDEAAADLVNDRHTFAGLCPESANDFAVRDPDCPACRALNLLPQAAAAIRAALGVGEWSSWSADDRYAEGYNQALRDIRSTLTDALTNGAHDGA